MKYYIILGMEVLFLLWFMSWLYITQFRKIYALAMQEQNKATKRLLQWEVFTTLVCTVILLYALLRILLSPAF